MNQQGKEIKRAVAGLVSRSGAALAFRLVLANLVHLSHRSVAAHREGSVLRISDCSGTSFDRSIDVQVWRLRHKIEPNPRRSRPIKTMHRVGCMFAGAVSSFGHRAAVDRDRHQAGWAAVVACPHAGESGVDKVKHGVIGATSLAAGLVLLPTPAPVGLGLILLGLFFLTRGSRRVRGVIRAVRTRLPRLDRALSRPRALPRGARYLLLATRPRRAGRVPSRKPADRTDGKVSPPCESR